MTTRVMEGLADADRASLLTELRDLKQGLAAARKPLNDQVGLAPACTGLVRPC